MSKYKERKEPIYQLRERHKGYIGYLSNTVGTYKGFDISVNAYSISLLNMFYISNKSQTGSLLYMDENGVLQQIVTYFQNAIECLEAIDKHIPEPSPQITSSQESDISCDDSV